MSALVGGMLFVTLLGGGASAAPTPTALQLNGSSQYVTFGAAPGLGATQFTLELWFKRTGAGLGTGTGTGGIANAIPLITKGRAEAETPANLNMNYFLGIDVGTGVLVADYEDTSGGANHPITGVTAVTSNVWHHAAVTFSGTALSLYLDGALDKTMAVTATPESTSIQQAALGTAMTSTGVAAGFFQGIIDEARIWNVARTQAQIQASKDAELTSATGLVGRWGMNEGAGSTIGDSTGNLNIGTATGAPTWSSDVPATTAAPAWNAGLYMNGASSYVTFGAAPSLGAAQFTLETWFKRTGAGVGTSTGSGGIASAVPLVTKGRAEAEGSNVDMNYFLGIDTATNKLAVDFEEGATGASPGLNHPLIGNTVVTNNVWHHAAATYDGASWKLYLDGAPDGSLAVGQPPRSDSIQHAALGTAMTSTGAAAGFFQGVIDEPRIWNYARTQAQIQGSRDVAIQSASGLIGRWGLNEGGGTTAATSSGTANGTIVNAGWVAGAPLTTDSTPPAQPQGLTALPGDGSISLSWTPNSESDLAGYNLFRATASPVPTTGTPVNGSSLLASPAYIDNGLSNGTTYHYVVVAVDNVGNASTASAEAVATPAPSGPHALEFNGSTQYVTMGPASSLGTSQFTLETWFKRTGAGVGTSTGTGGIASAIPLVTKGRAEAEGSNLDMNYFLGIDAASGKLVGDFEDTASGGNHPVTGQTSISSNVWHQAAATFDGSSWRLYLDGVLDAKVDVSATPRSDSIQHAALGTAMNSTGVASGFFAGDLDEARIWNYARTGTQIRSSRDSAISSATGLLGRFGMDEGMGTNVANSAGSPNGTAVGGPTWIAGYGFPHDGTAPAAPIGFTATPADGSALLSWSANTETDLAGYNLYRSTSTPVDTSGTPLNGADLIQGTSYTDGGLTNGTLYHYALVAVDGSDNRSTASEATVTPQPPPPTAHALAFNGSSQYVTMGPAATLDAAQFTLETWFKWTGGGAPTSTGAGGISAIPLVTKGRAESEGSSVDMNYFLGISGGKLAADFEEGIGGAGPLGQNHPITGATTITSGVWHHAAATYDGTTWKLYLDGVLDGKLAVGQPPRSDSIQYAALGTAMNSAGVADGFFAGDLDEARIWNYARTGAQIRASRSSEISTATGLLARFGMNEGSGTTVGNSAGSTNGTAVGPPTWIAGYDFPQDTLAPAAPANVVATADDGSAALSWDANAESDLAGYDLYRSTSTPVSTAGSPINGSDLIQGTTYSDTGLTNGTTYYYALIAVDGSNNRSVASGEASATPVQGDPVLAGAGDIATCTGTGDEDTAGVLDTMPGAGVFTIGDNVYDNGLASEFTNCYTPSWGRPSIKNRTRPTIGNHDYGNGTNNGGGYFDYFNGAGNFTGAAGDRDKGYYSYDVGDHWHVVVLNTECYYFSVCDPAAQLQWLRGDLGANSSKNVIAMWHRPRWSSGPSSPGLTTLQPLWQTLYDYGVELLLVGHDHHYERFAPQNAAGQLDAAHGVREIIVGTGGAEFSSVGAPVANSQVRNNVTNGVLKLTLHASSFDWRFIPAGTGTFTDSGTDQVHAAPANTPPTATVSLSSSSPKTNDTVTATATKSDTDGQAVSLTYVWKVNNVVKRTFTSSAALTDTFGLGAAGNGDKGDVVSVEVTPNDGLVDGTPAVAQATVANTTPAFSQDLQDRTSAEGAAISLSASATDADADILTYAATGLPPGLTIDAQSGLISGTVSSTGSGIYAVDVTATDGTATVHDSFSWTITHRNRPPVVSSVAIDQAAPKTNDVLSVTISASDPDGDPLTYGYQWTKNGTDLPGKTSATLDLGTAGNGDKNDAIAVRVTANDGAATSDPMTSTSVTVQNSAPTVSVVLDNTSPGTDDTVTATATTGDLDGDGVAVTYVWQVTGATRQTTTNSSGSDSFDLSAANNGDIGDSISVTATPNDGTADGTPASALATVVGAPAGKAVQFDGTNDYVTFGPAPGLGAAQFTLETWFKRTGPGFGTNTGTNGVANAIPLVTKGRAEAEGSNVDMNYFLGIDATNGKLVADFEDMASGQNHPVTGNTVVTDNVWHHAAATYDGTTWRLYLDGAPDGSLSVGQAPRSDSIQHAALGTALNSTGVAAGFFQGALDEARIWNYARTQAQIVATKDYEVRTVPGLIGHWAMDAGSGGLLADSSGNAVDGTLTNGPTWVPGFPTTPDTTAPGAPQGLSATAGDGSVSLTWTASGAADLAGYDVYRSTSTPVSTVGQPLNSRLLAAPSYTDGTAVNGTTYYYVVQAVDAADNASSASGEANATPQRASHALSFDGATQYVTFGPASQLGASTFTLETWFKRTGAGVGTSTGSGGIASAIPLVTKGRAEAETPANLNMNYFLGIDATSGALVADFEDSATGANHPISGQTVVTQNVWHHAAATYDGATWRLYLDGALDAKLAVGATPESSSVQHAALATAMNSSGVAAGFFAGQLDEARIWNVARSGAQIRGARDSEITTASGLVGRFGMNDGSGAAVGNSAGLPNGTAVNSPAWVAGYGFPQDTTAPAAPQGFTASPDDQSVTLTWTSGPEPDLAGYDLYRSSSTPVDTSGTPVNGADLITGASYTDGGLTNGTTYHYALVAVDGSNNRSVSSAEVTATPVSGDPVLIGAGDIAKCTSSGDEATADLVAAAPNAGVFTLGDNVYDNGLASEFASCYSPSWGRPGIKARTRPTVGNHDYGNGSNTGDGYFDYFNGAGNFTGAAGDRDKGYYSYDVGQYWHVVVLNSECYYFTSECSAAAEEQWLRTDLDANASKNVIAMWHRPRWSSGASSPGLATLQPLWQILYDYGVELSLVGHDHHYERFAPQDANGQLDDAHGVREIIVGTGGAEFTSVGAAAPNSVVRNGSTWGVLKLRLHQSSYDWQFLPVAGGTFTDSGTGTTHGRPALPPVIDSVVIDQAAPKTADTLTVTVTSHDPNNDPVTYAYQWQRNGVDIAGATGATLNLATAGNGDKNDAISVRVTASDGALTSAPVTSAAVTVVNSPPTATVVLSPASPGTNQTLTATATRADADGDAVTLTYVWKVNGVMKRTQTTTALTDTFDLSQAGNGDGGDTIAVEVTPSDATAAGVPATASVTVDNTPPATPSGLGTTLTSTSVKLDWANNTEPDLAGYSVYRASAAGGPYDKVSLSTLTVSEYVDTSAPPAATSYYRVTALDTNGNESVTPAEVTVVRRISFRAASPPAQNGGANTITIAKPSGVQPGDVLVAAIGVLNAPVITAPPGWAQVVNTTSGTALRQAVFSHVVSAGDPASYTWTFASAQGAAGVISAYAGVDTSTPVATSSGQANGSSTSITAASVSPAVTDTLLVGVFGLPTNSTIAPPGSMLEQGESALASGKQKLDVELADELRGSAGATATRVATASKAAANIGQLIALRPIGAALPPPTAPDAPTGLTASAGNNVVHLTWAAPTNDGGSTITAYHVYRSTTAGGETSPFIATTTATNYDDMTAVNGTTYYYKVAAVNMVGEGAKSNEASATPTAGPTAPGAPTLNSATGTVGGIDVAWTAPASNGGSPITGYKVYRGTVSGTYGTPVSLGNVTTYRDTTATPGTQYFYVVTAFNAVGESLKSNELNATAQAGAVPGAPQNLTAQAAKGKGVTLNWQAPASNGGSAITGYRVYRGTTASGEGSTPVTTVTGTTLTFKDTTGTRGTTYYYVVTAVNTAGESPNSNEANATAR